MTLLLGASGDVAPPIDLLPLAAVLLAAWVSGWLATRVGYPAVLGELLAGIVLGPPLLGVLSDGVGLDVIGHLGIILMMLYVGTEIDLDDLRRASRAGLLAAIGGFVVPFALGVVTMLLFGFGGVEAVFVGAAVGVTSLATKSRILADLQLFDTRIAYVLVAGALLSDTATLVLFAGVLAFAGEGGGTGAMVVVAAETVAFFAVALGFAAVAPRLGAWVRRRFGAEGLGYGTAVLVVGGLGGAAVAELFGLHAILGAFVAGMILRRGVLSGRTARRAAELVERLSIGVLAPVFFVTAGFAISLTAARENFVLLVAVIGVATVGKILGTALFYLPTGHGWREGVVVGGAMNGRGAVEIVVAGIGLERGLISTDVFTVLVLMAILTTAAVPVLLKVGVEWLRSRNELVDAEGTRRGVTIVGASAVARAYASALSPNRDVWLLDSNPGRCASARREGLQAVAGDAVDVDALRRARADEAGLLLAMTPNVEVNLLAAELARDEFGVRDVHASCGPQTAEGPRMLLERIGAHPVFTVPIDLERWSTWIEEGEAVVTAQVVDDERQAASLDAQLATGGAGVPLAVLRGDDAIPYPQVDRLRPADRVVLLVRSDAPPLLDETPSPAADTIAAEAEPN